MSSRQALTVSAALLGVFLILTGLVVVDRDLVVDRSLLEWIVDERTSGLTSAVQLLTHLGSGWVLYPLTAVAAGVWWWRDSDWRPGVLLAASLLGATVLYGVTKAAVERPRPSAADAVGTYTNWSFPSGHATQSMAFYGMLAFLIAGGRLRPVWPWATAGGPGPDRRSVAHLPGRPLADGRPGRLGAGWQLVDGGRCGRHLRRMGPHPRSALACPLYSGRTATGEAT